MVVTQCLSDNLSMCALNARQIHALFLTPPQVKEANVTEANVTEANVTEANVTEANVKEANVKAMVVYHSYRAMLTRNCINAYPNTAYLK